MIVEVMIKMMMKKMMMLWMILLLIVDHPSHPHLALLAAADE